MGGDIQNEEIFESTGITDFQDADAPKLSRMNAQKQVIMKVMIDLSLKALNESLLHFYLPF